MYDANAAQNKPDSYDSNTLGSSNAQNKPDSNGPTTDAQKPQGPDHYNAEAQALLDTISFEVKTNTWEEEKKAKRRKKGKSERS